MKLVKFQNFLKKFVIVILMIMSFEFVNSNTVQAETDGVGGKLIEPFLSLATSLGDGIVDILHESIMGQSETNIRVDMSTTLWDKIGGVVIGIVVGIVVIVAIIATCGLAAMALAAVGITATVSIGVGTIITGVVSGVMVGVWYDNTCLPNDVMLPMYSLSAEEIFKGNILLFDVDFFNPQEDIYVLTKSNQVYRLTNRDKTAIENIVSSKDDPVQQYFYYKDGQPQADHAYNEAIDGSDKIVRTSKQNTAVEVQGTISKWYNALRNICLVLMMSVLLYVAIRMMLSSIAADKAKYKQMLTDWLVRNGIIILFTLCYGILSNNRKAV